MPDISSKLVKIHLRFSANSSFFSIKRIVSSAYSPHQQVHYPSL
jgi:hypothetical protein